MAATSEDLVSPDQEALLLLNDHEAEICQAVARAVDERGLMPDQVVVLVLRAGEKLGPFLARRFGLAFDGGEIAVGAIRLAEAEGVLDWLGLPRGSLASGPSHGRVRSLCTVCSTLVLGHSLYVFPHNRDEWQRRLDRLIDGALETLQGSRPGKGPPS